MKIKKISKLAIILLATGFILVTAFAAFASNISVNQTANSMIDIQQLSLQSDSHEEYGRHSFKKGDVISVDISWAESGNVYFAIGKKFGDFRGLESSGDSTFLNTAIEVKEDGDYYIFMGIPGMENKDVNGIMGEITYPVN